MRRRRKRFKLLYLPRRKNGGISCQFERIVWSLPLCPPLPHGGMLLLSPAGAFKKGNVTINGDLRVIGGLSVNRIASSSLSVNGSITVSGALRTGFVKAQAAKFSVLETTSLSSPSGSLQVTGDLNMQTSGAASFLEVGSLHTERLFQHRRWQV